MQQGFSVSLLALSQTPDYGQTNTMDVQASKVSTVFRTNFAYWNAQTNMLSDNTLDNDYFEAIVAMGKDAIPFIKEELDKGPTMLVHALNRIMPNTIVPQDYLPLPILCSLWQEYLNQK